MYLALTGRRLNGAEMAGCGLATHYVPIGQARGEGGGGYGREGEREYEGGRACKGTRGGREGGGRGVCVCEREKLREDCERDGERGI